MTTRPDKCPDCGGTWIGVEYTMGTKNYYDGVSEWWCPGCSLRLGRWTLKRLAEGESEPRYGGA